jgi:hypothetical protein
MAVFVANLLSVVLVLFPDIFVNFCLQFIIVAVIIIIVAVVVVIPLALQPFVGFGFLRQVTPSFPIHC